MRREKAEMRHWGRGLSIALSVWALGGVSVQAAAIASSLICSNPGSTKATDRDVTINANSCTDFSYKFPNSQPDHGLNNWLYGYYTGAATAQGVTPPAYAASTFHPMTPVYVDANGNPSQALPAAGNGVHAAGWWALDFTRFWTSLDAFGGHPNSTSTDLHSGPFCNQALYQNCGSGWDSRGAASPGAGEQWAVRRYVAPTTFNGLVDITLQVQKDPNSQGGDGDANYVIRYSGGAATQLGAIMMGAQGPVQSLSLTGVALKAGDFLDFAISARSNDFNDGEFQVVTIKSESGPQTMPEPASLALAGMGLLGFAIVSRWRKYANPS